MLRARTGGDSVLKVLRGGILVGARLDSASAPRIATLLGCDAMLTVRIDQFEQHEPEWTYYYADFGTWALNMALLPYYLIVEPQWTQAISHGEVVPVTYTGQPPLPPQTSPGAERPGPSTARTTGRPGGPAGRGR